MEQRHMIKRNHALVWFGGYCCGDSIASMRDLVRLIGTYQDNPQFVSIIYVSSEKIRTRLHIPNEDEKINDEKKEHIFNEWKKLIKLFIQLNENYLQSMIDLEDILVETLDALNSAKNETNI